MTDHRMNLLTEAIVNLLGEHLEMDKYEIDWNSQEYKEQTIQRLHRVIIKWGCYQVHRT